MMMSMNGDWIEDESLTREQKLAIFEALEPVEVSSPQKVTITHEPPAFALAWRTATPESLQAHAQ